MRAITQVMALLSDLRAEDFAANAIGDGKVFGLDQPFIVAAWSSERSPGDAAKIFARRSEVGPHIGLRRSFEDRQAVPGKTGTYYAALDAQPYVFTLGAQAVQIFLAEFHDLRVMTFPG